MTDTLSNAALRSLRRYYADEAAKFSVPERYVGTILLVAWQRLINIAAWSIALDAEKGRPADAQDVRDFATARRRYSRILNLRTGLPRH